MKRCSWAKSAESIHYHDNVWGRVTHDETTLFKFLILEGLQAGLSWDCILKKEKAYDIALDNFDYHKISQYDENKYLSLMDNAQLIRNKLKNRAIINNAKCFIEVQKQLGSFDAYIWGFVDYQPIDHLVIDSYSVPTFDQLSTQISNDLKKKGFKFVGPTIIYSYLQAIGIYNDHEIDCSFH